MSELLVFPIFPLAEVILVPGCLLPLHVFEPRYRAMVADALAGDRLIAMAFPIGGTPGPGEEADRVHPVCGLGRIVSHQPYPDGRSNIVLAGVARMRIVREIETGGPYRKVEAEVLDDVHPDGVDLDARARCILRRLAIRPDAARRELEELDAPGILDALLPRLPIPVREKYELFAMADVAARLDATERAVARIGGPPGAYDLHPGDPRRN